MPDHTLPTYQAAFESGADWIELDAHSTLDGHLVTNHDIELSETTDVADWEWAAGRRTRTRAPCEDGEHEVMEGWMVPDFTLAELKRLRVKMRSPGRDQQFDLQYEIPGIAETCEFVQGLLDDILISSAEKGRSWTKKEWITARNDFVLKHGRARGNLGVGLYIETKRPAWYRSLGLPLEEQLAAEIDSSSFQGPIIIQSFEEDSLRRMRSLKPQWPTVKLMTEDIDKLDRTSLGEYLDHLVGEVGCSGIGPYKRSIVPDPTNPPSSSILVDEAHSRGLFVHPYTFRSDVLALDLVYGGNASHEFAQFFDLGVDGVFADFPSHAVYARELYNRARLAGQDLQFRFWK